MSEFKTLYKVVPKVVENPKNYKQISNEEFERLKKVKIEEGASLCEGHLGTVIWYSDNSYIVQVKVLNSKDSFVITPCTHEPIYGMDSLDGSFAQDAEAYVLMNKVNFSTSRLDIFNGEENIDPVDYIKRRGFGEGRSTSIVDAEKAAEFNRLYKIATDLIDDLMLLHENSDKRYNWFQKRKIKKSIGLLEKCISIFPDSWNSMWLIGKAYQSLQDSNQALMCFENAFKIESKNPDVAREAALQAINLGISEKAIFYAEKAIEADGNDPGLYSNYALALLIGKRGDEALVSIKKAMQMNPTDPINREVLRLVQSVVDGKMPYPQRL
jgi:tetratricopeptide (TPR) repeat protein